MSNSEYISRDAVDNVLLELEERLINNPFALTAMAMAIDKIDNISHADVAPVVHGHWVKDSDIDYGCSACGRRQLWMNATVYEYCPNCGAKMDEEA